MKLNCNGKVIDDRLHFRFDDEQVDMLYFILLQANINMIGNMLYEKEYRFCHELLYVVEKSRRERLKRGLK